MHVDALVTDGFGKKGIHAILGPTASSWGCGSGSQGRLGAILSDTSCGSTADTLSRSSVPSLSVNVTNSSARKLASTSCASAHLFCLSTCNTSLRRYSASITRAASSISLMTRVSRRHSVAPRCEAPKSSCHHPYRVGAWRLRVTLLRAKTARLRALRDHDPLCDAPPTTRV
jgi:hypothetical protein